MMDETYRGVLEYYGLVKDEYGNTKRVLRRRVTKCYSKPHIAAGQATRNTYGIQKNQIVDKYVEQAVEWKRID